MIIYDFVRYQRTGELYGCELIPECDGDWDLEGLMDELLLKAKEAKLKEAERFLLSVLLMNDRKRKTGK